VPRGYDLGGTTGVHGGGVGVPAYTFGLRHAFDADHIAAVDNTTRKPMADDTGRKPLSVGSWFSLGHSTSTSCLPGRSLAISSASRSAEEGGWAV